VIGLDVPHAHIHLLPINSATDMHLRPSSADVKPDLAAIQQRILDVLNAKS
jgi:histidine triad (HIT) family protein